MNEKLLTPFVLNYPFLQDKSVVEMNIILVEANISAQLQQAAPQEKGWTQVDCQGLICRADEKCWLTPSGGVGIVFCCLGNPNIGFCDGRTTPKLPKDWVQIYSESQMFQGGGGQGGLIQPVTICDSLGRQEINAYKKYRGSLYTLNRSFQFESALLVMDHEDCRDNRRLASGNAPLYCDAWPIQVFYDPIAKELIVSCVLGCQDDLCCLQAKESAAIISKIHRLELAEIEKALKKELEKIERLRLLYKCTDGGRLGETDAPPFEPPPAP